MDEKIEIKIFSGHNVRLKLDSKAEAYLCAIADVISLINETDPPIDYWSKIKNIEKQYGIDLSNIRCTLKISNLKENLDSADGTATLRIIQPISQKTCPTKGHIS